MQTNLEVLETNARKDYNNTPSSVLSYIIELENKINIKTGSNEETAVEWLEKQTWKPEWKSLMRGDILIVAKEKEKLQKVKPIQEMIDFINDLNESDTTEFNYYYDCIMDKLNEMKNR